MLSFTTVPLGWLFEILVIIGLLRNFKSASVKRKQRIARAQDPEMEKLREDVLPVVKRYKDDDATEPPFKMAEIIVMSAILSNGHYPGCVLKETLIANIEKNFRYYRVMTLKELWEAADPFASRFHASLTFTPVDYEKERLMKRRSNERPYSADEAFALMREADALVDERNALYQFDLPLRSLPDNPERGCDALGWTYEAGPMRKYLSDALESAQRQTFRIMDLPAELRLHIFEYVLQYHWSGLGFEAQGQRLRVLRPSMSPADGRMRESWLNVNIGRDFTHSLFTERPSDMLALLLVNRQFLADAMPIFYKTNHFHANSAERVIYMLRGCGERRRKYFTSISFRCHANGEGGKAERAFQLLSTVPGLQYLGIDLAVEKDWLTMGSNMSRQPAPYHTTAWQQRDVGEIPALLRLDQCSTREAYFHSSCPIIEEYLKGRILQRLPKHEVAKKRIEMEKEEKDGKRGDRKAKRTRAKDNRRRVKEASIT
ncbi:hypothetical protein B0A48_02369 [Cryoendolithus antarcticus]|uniref:DUF7730 domain-containing protein n=1 Tax=Cryoendolithus antarcticus TaxID=1507870 RepID=A0A1V8TNF6_9PEZI|nr:hypothetical protein B0A48_02369 [Cryoendolithus antarcticus]